MDHTKLLKQFLENPLFQVGGVIVCDSTSKVLLSDYKLPYGGQGRWTSTTCAVSHTDTLKDYLVDSGGGLAISWPPAQALERNLKNAMCPTTNLLVWHSPVKKNSDGCIVISLNYVHGGKRNGSAAYKSNGLRVHCVMLAVYEWYYLPPLRVQ